MSTTRRVFFFLIGISLGLTLGLSCVANASDNNRVKYLSCVHKATEKARSELNINLLLYIYKVKQLVFNHDPNDVMKVANRMEKDREKINRRYRDQVGLCIKEY